MTNRTVPRIAAVGAAFALTVPLAACGDDPEPAPASTVTETAPAGSQTPERGSPSAPTSPSGADDQSGVLMVPIDWRDAVNKAKAEADGEVSDLTLDREGDRYVYDVELSAGNQEREVHVDAQTGEVVQRDGDGDDDDDDDRNETFDVGTLKTPKDAQKVALERVPGRVTEWSLDRDDDDDGDRTTYTIDISANGDDDREVEVDAVTGNVIEIDD
ncbi:PepSY domain-containing protein [Gordonia zhaorongruii]|uniref:PepSY domain-containing protein n=1 Tax=Gordonia zhaorongruii TaxID=2597659 RepID=UPI0010455BFB|nr:PepSY domain-containing protein [Gordonia zhaorongruii]